MRVAAIGTLPKRKAELPVIDTIAAGGVHCFRIGISSPYILYINVLARNLLPNLTKRS
jgi:hypothetical protein